MGKNILESVCWLFGMNRWKSAARYVELIEGWIIDTGAGYIAIRKADGRSENFSPWMGVYNEMREFLKSKEE